MWRVQAFADAGADMLFVDALESEEEMRLFCRVAGSVPKVCIGRGRLSNTDHPPRPVCGWSALSSAPPHRYQPSESLTSPDLTSWYVALSSLQMANMLEGGGKTPVLSPAQLQDIGYRVSAVGCVSGVASPLSLLGPPMLAPPPAVYRLPSVTAVLSPPPAAGRLPPVPPPPPPPRSLLPTLCRCWASASRRWRARWRACGRAASLDHSNWGASRTSRRQWGSR